MVKFKSFWEELHASAPAKSAHEVILSVRWDDGEARRSEIDKYHDRWTRLGIFSGVVGAGAFFGGIPGLLAGCFIAKLATVHSVGDPDSDEAPTAAADALSALGWQVYYPNRFDKEDSGVCTGYDCKRCKRSHTPNDDWCWAAAYFWQLKEAFDHHGDGACMLQIKEDGRLGAGQLKELEMAQQIGIRVVVVDVPRRAWGNWYDIKKKLIRAGFPQK